VCVGPPVTDTNDFRDYLRRLAVCPGYRNNVSVHFCDSGPQCFLIGDELGKPLALHFSALGKEVRRLCTDVLKLRPLITSGNFYGLVTVGDGALAKRKWCLWPYG